MAKANELAESYTGPRWAYASMGVLVAFVFAFPEVIEALGGEKDFTLGDLLKLLAWAGGGAGAGLVFRSAVKRSNLDGRRSRFEKIIRNADE